MPAQLTPQLRLLGAYLAPQRARIALLAMLMLADLVLQLALPRVAQQFIDGALAGAVLQALLAIGGVYLVVALTQNLTSVSWHYVAQNIGLIATNHIRADLTQHCLKLDMSFHNAHTPGEMIERVDGDVTKLTNFLSSFLVQIVLNGLLVLGVIGALFVIHWRVGLPVASAVAIAMFSSRKIASRLTPVVAQERQASADLFGFLEERLSGTEDIRANGATTYVLRRHIEHTRTLFHAALKSALLGVVSWRSVESLLDIGAVLGLALGALLFLDGALSLGTIYVIFAYTQMLTYPVEQILRQLSDLQQATASVGRVQALFDTRSSLIQKPPAKTTALPSGALSVTVSQVTFAYPGDDAVLHDVSVHVSAGSTLGVLGRTGSGKTTLTRLLLRLYDPASGAVRIGDVDLRETYNADLRQRITIVTQDVQLFSASVRDNLTLFDESIADAQIQNALAAVGLADWAAALPHGLNTLLSAGSTSLSAGEAQLLAFARAFLRNPGLVILDEASSRLDPATEQKLEQAVDKLLAGRTGIIIAHRLRTLDRVQQILILEDGRVIENGARAVLVRDANSRFAQLLHTGIEQALV